MSNVVAFRPERTGRTAVRRRDEGAEILFFTGIRYMREELSVLPTAPEPEPVDAMGDEGGEDFATERLKA